MVGNWDGKNAVIKVVFRGGRGSETLWFTAKPILRVSDSHITFRDKFNKVVTFSMDSVKSIREIEE